MSNTNTGGPAFPTIEENGLNSGEPGMTLRDYFAAKLIQGIYANPGRVGTCYDAARRAYEAADAMLVVRKENT